METRQYRHYIDDVEDFPKPGVTFYDVAPLIGNGEVFAGAVTEMAEPLQGRIDKIVGFDARGFLFGAAMALELGVGFAMLRKAGKLPGGVDTMAYGLEYGSDSLQIQKSALRPGERVALVDDIIATGGTARAGIELVRAQGAEIAEFVSLIDLPHLGGADIIRSLGIAVRPLIEIRSDA